jgi:RNA-directed DNA polymerase
MVAGTASPDDPTLARYWADRRGKQPNGPLPVLLLARLKAQRGRCARCGTHLLHAEREPQSPEEWELWLRTVRWLIRKDNIATNNGPDDQRLIHTACRSRAAGTTAPALLTATPSRPA